MSVIRFEVLNVPETELKQYGQNTFAGTAQFYQFVAYDNVSGELVCMLCLLLCTPII